MRPLSAQLYTVREALKASPKETLEEVASIGYTRVEPFDLVNTGRSLREDLQRLNLTAPTAHMRLLDADRPAVFEVARELGVECVIDPFIDPERWTSREGVTSVAEDLKGIAAEARDQGLRIGYHNHAFELENTIEGTPALEVFADLVGDAVELEVDTYWAQVGGVDAPELLKRLGERVTAIHVKDGPGTTRNKDQVAVGSGDMPVEAILAAAPAALAVVELDDSEGDLLAALRASYAFLTTK